MRWAIGAAALVVVANGTVLISTGRERAAPAALTTIAVCPSQVVGGGSSDEPPVLRLLLAPDSLSTPTGLDPSGLRALGFAEPVIATAGRERDSPFRTPRPRPAWVRLRQRDDSSRSLAVVEVAPLRRRLRPDSLSLVVRGLVSLRERKDQPPAPENGHQHSGPVASRTPGVVYPAVLEVIPFQLHLERAQIANLRGLLPDTAACATTAEAVIGSGTGGGIWVAAVR